ncbi:MAG: hypothetical protein K2O16_15390 [Lachnospiraceae bacterium]|nr:hypothetical protein [Lachnospiraceae bacterium]
MKQKNILKLTAATLAIIGAGTILFNSAAEVALAANNGKVEKVPTSYQVSDSLETALPKSETKEEGSAKVNYSVSMDSLNTGTPTDTDLTMEEAAETGAQYLRDIYGLDLEGAYVYMMYSPGTETFPRAFWTGDVLFQKEQTPESTRWTYLIDAVTGELFDICHGRQLDVNVSLGYDASLEKDYRLYAELAQKKTEECKLMDSPVDRVEYNCQGYSGNDPTISVDVIGQNGEIVNMTFSRYDQMFLGFDTDTSRKISESALMRLAGEAVEIES